VNFAKYSLARSATALAILGLFLLPLLGLKGLAGGLAGSLVFGWANLLDLFAFAESVLSSRSMSLAAIYAVGPLVLAYLILGRVFCGWVCPLDLIFRGIDRLNRRGDRASAGSSARARGEGSAEPAATPSGGSSMVPRAEKSSPWKGCLLPVGFLVAAAAIQAPLFTAYVSPIANFNRSLYAGFFYAAGLPGEAAVLAVSALILAAFFLLEFFRPRLWCRGLCPVGKMYGFFNHLSLLHLEFNARECTSCRHCQEVCYMGVDILSSPARDKIRDSSCILCGRCVEACPSQKATLTLRFGK